MNTFVTHYYLAEARMAKHRLSKEFGLSAPDLLDAIDARLRLRVALEGAVAEVHMLKHVTAMQDDLVDRYEHHDIDGHPDISIWLHGRRKPLLLECKNVRESSKPGGEAYRTKGQVVANKVETQKTRASKGDPSSRFYDVDQFDILGVCLGKKTGNWSDIVYARTSDLVRHKSYPRKLAVMQRVPLPGSNEQQPWYPQLAELLASYG